MEGWQKMSISFTSVCGPFQRFDYSCLQTSLFMWKHVLYGPEFTTRQKYKYHTVTRSIQSRPLIWDQTSQITQSVTLILNDLECLLQAPLLLGCDVRNMTKETLKIVSNKEVIAVNQGDA